MQNETMEKIEEGISSHRKILISIFIIFVAIGAIYVLFKYTGTGQANFEKQEDGQIVNLESYNEKLSHPEEDDVLNQIITANGGKNAVNIVEAYSPTSTNLTDLIARDIFVASKYSANDINIDNPELFANTLSNAVTNYTKPSITTSLIVSTTTSPSSIRIYGNDMSYIYSFLETMTRGMIGQLVDYNSTNNNADLRNMQKFSEYTQKVCDMYKNYPGVPVDATNIHRNILLACDSFYGMLTGLAQQESDPLKAVIALQAMTTIQNDIKNSLTEYSKYFNKKNIIYKKEEAGVIFTNNFK